MNFVYYESECHHTASEQNLLRFSGRCIKVVRLCKVCEKRKLSAILVISNRNCTFSVEFWVGAPLKSCSKVVRLALYVGIFQFYCTWKIDNCRIFRPNLRFVHKILRWAALSWLVEKTSLDLMQICFPKFSESVLKRFVDKTKVFWKACSKKQSIKNMANIDRYHSNEMRHM